MTQELTKFLTSVIFRVLLVLLGGALLKVGFTEDESKAGLQQIAELVMGAVLLALPVAWAAIQHKAALLKQPPKEHPISLGRIPVLALACALAGTSQGCALLMPPPGRDLTTEEKLRVAERTMTTIETTILTAQAMDVIDAKTARELLDAGAVLHVAYNALFDRYQNGEPIGFEAAHDAFNAALKTYLEQLNAKGVKVERKPSGEVSYVDPGGRSVADRERSARFRSSLRPAPPYESAPVPQRAAVNAVGTAASARG